MGQGEMMLQSQLYHVGMELYSVRESSMITFLPAKFHIHYFYTQQLSRLQAG